MDTGLSTAHTQPTAGRSNDALKRADILRAGTMLFLKEGYERTSMEAVAKKANVSKLTIYSHFTDKADLFRHVIHMRCDKLASPESFLVHKGKPVRQALTEIAMAFVAHIFTPDAIKLHRILQAEGIRHPHIARIFYESGPKRVRATFGELLQYFVDDRQLSISDVAKASEQFFSLIKGEMMHRIQLGLDKYPSAAEMKKHIKASVDMFIAAYERRKTN
jgi:TetR/AcrR family transcriptional regulator, mexJK operon transcriptional repressor